MSFLVEDLTFPVPPSVIGQLVPGPRKEGPFHHLKFQFDLFTLELKGNQLFILHSENLNPPLYIEFAQYLIPNLFFFDNIVIVVGCLGTVYYIHLDKFDIELSNYPVNTFDIKILGYDESPLDFCCIQYDQLIVTTTHSRLVVVRPFHDEEHQFSFLQYEKSTSFMSQITSTPVKFMRSLTGVSLSLKDDEESNRMVISMTSISNYLATLSRDGKLRIWNLHSGMCIKVHDLKDTIHSHTVFPLVVKKLLTSFLDTAQQCYFLTIHLPYPDSPSFIVLKVAIDRGMEITPCSMFEIDNSHAISKLVDFNVTKDISQSKNDLLLDTCQWTLWVLWDSVEVPLQFTHFSTLDSSVYIKKWYNCIHQASNDFEYPVIDDYESAIDLDFLNFILDNNKFSLENIAQVCGESAMMNYEDSKLAILRCISGMMTDCSGLSLSEIQQTLIGCWQQFLSRLIDKQKSDLESLALYFDSDTKCMKILKNSNAVGTLRSADLTELISFDQLWVIAPGNLFSGPLESVQSTGIRNGLATLIQLSNYISTEILSESVVNDLEHELLCTTVSYELTLDDYFPLVLTQIDAVDEYKAAKVLFYFSRIGPLSSVLEQLLVCLQPLDIAMTDTSSKLQDGDIDLFVVAIKKVLKKRYQFIRDIYMALLVLYSLVKESQIPRNIFAQWRSLYCCYTRTNWFASQFIKSSFEDPALKLSQLQLNESSTAESHYCLLDVILKNHITIDWNPVNWTEDFTITINSILAQFGTLTAHPLGSLEECQPVIRWANIMIPYCASEVVRSMLEMVPCPSAAKSYLLGLTWLTSLNWKKSRYHFEQAAAGIDSVCSNLSNVLPDEVESNNIFSYYIHVMKKYEEVRVPAYVIHFGNLALQSIQYTKNQIDSQQINFLRKTVFLSAINSGDWNSAYDSMIQMSDLTLRRNCLESLITELCNHKELQLLCGGFSFAGLTNQVEDSLLFKCRSEKPSPQLDSHFYKVCYSYFIYRSDFRNAARVMFDHAKKLQKLEWNSSFGESEIRSVLTRLCSCFLTSLNALEVVDQSDAYLEDTVAKGELVFYELLDIPEDNSDTKVNIVEPDNIRQLYHLALAKLELFPSYNSLAKSFDLPVAKEVFTKYCQQHRFDRALNIARLFRLDYSGVFVSFSQVIAKQINGESCHIPDEDDEFLSGMTQINQSWYLLRSLLEKQDNAANNWKYYQICIHNLLIHHPNLAIPKWLLEPFNCKLSDILIRIYINHNRLKDAANLAIDYITDITVTSTNTHCSNWLSLNTLESLQQNLEKSQFKNEFKKLNITLLNYQASIQV
ncbi:hypothetical protein BC833DRAFT_599110 [Globomyces pollinis-pini]|nr:hypothetical protein BC833DRAFT_599110 [Globomyces pollinis-pini]